MKQIAMMTYIVLTTLLMATNSWAQTHHSSIDRSEQFILDSLRMEVELTSIESRNEMYADSLQHQLDVRGIGYNTTEEITQLLIPISFFAFIILIIWLCLWFSFRKQNARYRIIEKAIDNGQEIPGGLFDEPKKNKNSWSNTLRHAIIYIAIGIGIALLGETSGVDEITAIAVIPGIIGLGYLLVAFIERKEQHRTEHTPADDNAAIMHDNITEVEKE